MPSSVSTRRPRTGWRALVLASVFPGVAVLTLGGCGRIGYQQLDRTSPGDGSAGRTERGGSPPDASLETGGGGTTSAGGTGTGGTETGGSGLGGTGAGGSDAATSSVTEYWLGGTDLDGEGQWMWLDTTRFWSGAVTGKALAYSHFATTSPQAGTPPTACTSRQTANGSTPTARRRSLTSASASCRERPSPRPSADGRSVVLTEFRTNLRRSRAERRRARCLLGGGHGASHDAWLGTTVRVHSGGRCSMRMHLRDDGRQPRRR